MKIILFADSFVFGDFEKDGKESHYGRLKGKTSGGRAVTALLWDTRAVAINREFGNLTPEGVEFRDMRFAVELEGRERLGRPRTGAGGREYRERVFHVDEFRILTGPALELHRARAAAGAPGRLPAAPATSSSGSSARSSRRRSRRRGGTTSSRAPTGRARRS